MPKINTVKSSLHSSNLDIERIENLHNLWHLRKISKILALANFFAGILFYYCTELFVSNNELSTGMGLVAILIALTPVIYAYVYKNLLLVFTPICILSLAPIWFLLLEAILPGYDAFDYIQPSYRIKAFFWISSFHFFINSLYYLFENKGHRLAIKFFSFFRTLNVNSKLFVRISFVSFILPLLSFYYFYGSADILWTALTAGRSGGGGGDGLLMRTSKGGSSSLMIPLVWLWKLTPLFGSIAFILGSKRNRIPSLISFIFGLLVVFVFFLGGSRGTLISVAAPILFFFFYYNLHRGLKFWLLAVTLMLLFIGVMELQVRFRGNLLEVLANPDQAMRDHGMKSVTTFDPTESHRDNNMYIFCLMLKGYPDKYNYLGFNDFFAMLANPIPRVIWPSKPVLIGAKELSFQRYFILDGPREMGTTSLTSSVVGEAYESAGMWGLFIYSIVYAALALFFDGVIYYLQRKQPLSIGILGIGVFLSFWGYRSLFALVTFIYPVLLLLLVLRVFRKR